MSEIKNEDLAIQVLKNIKHHLKSEIPLNFAEEEITYLIEKSRDTNDDTVVLIEVNGFAPYGSSSTSTISSLISSSTYTHTDGNEYDYTSSYSLDMEISISVFSKSKIDSISTSQKIHLEMLKLNEESLAMSNIGNDGVAVEIEKPNYQPRIELQDTDFLKSVKGHDYKTDYHNVVIQTILSCKNAEKSLVEYTDVESTLTLELN